MRAWLFASCSFAIGFWAASSAASGLMTLGPGHRATKSRAVLDRPLERELALRIASSDIRSSADARDFALSFAAGRLHFGLSHSTNRLFSMREREGNCIEYAELTAAVFERVARAKRLEARAWVVHSEQPRVLGMKVPLRGFDGHDWVLIDSRSSAERYYVDPTFYDSGLDWDLSGAIRGRVPLGAAR
jgi:hypothetical protein